MSKENLYYKLEKRDGPVCGICQLDISEELARYHLMHRIRRMTSVEREAHGAKLISRGSINISLDHVIPVSRGGEPAPANMKLAHSKCNSKKGNKLPEEILNQII